MSLDWECSLSDSVSDSLLLATTVAAVVVSVAAAAAGDERGPGRRLGVTEREGMEKGSSCREMLQVGDQRAGSLLTAQRRVQWSMA